MDELYQQIRWLKGTTGLGLLFLLLIWETVSPFFPLFKDLATRTHHAFRNAIITLLNAVMVTLLFAGLWAWAAQWSATRQFGLLHCLGLSQTTHAIGAILIFDCWTYIWHWLNHRVPFFWRFHRAHHSDALMDVTTANRFHLGEIAFSSLFRVPLIALFGIQLWEVALYETLLQAANLFQHANIGLSRAVDSLLRAFIVTPALHKVHHSRLQPETDSNYSSFLSVWDRLFRTLRLRENPHEIQFGLVEFDSPQHQSVAGVLRTPLTSVKPPPGEHGGNEQCG